MKNNLLTIFITILCSCVDSPNNKLNIDDDLDGFSEFDGDCDDTNASTYPGAAFLDSETDCMLDSDGDGYGSSVIESGQIIDERMPILLGTDCDDNDDASTHKSIDADCDTLDQSIDCDDNDSNSTSTLEDADCDGTITNEDCDDENPDSTIRINDQDCDFVVTEDDCDDFDENETADSDGDDVCDNDDEFPNDSNETVDSDGDGVGDNSDVFPEDGTETIDSDGDGVGDNSDEFPNNSNETVDSDGDGVGDNSDVFPEDGTEIIDSDGDGVGNNSDEFPNDSNETVDSDGDGVGDNSDVFPNDFNETVDSDGDGVGDNSDVCEGFLDGEDNDIDSIPDACDEDDDNDNVLDIDEINIGSDPLNPDTDGDGVNDDIDDFLTDACADTDSDSDGYPDILTLTDNNNDGLPDCGTTDLLEDYDDLDDGLCDIDTLGNGNSTSIDSDCDGITTDGSTDLDCDDNDPNIGADIYDTDCDHIDNCIDNDADGNGQCDDHTPAGPTVSTSIDSDCDGITTDGSTDLDCDDNDPNIGADIYDTDCDGICDSSTLGVGNLVKNDPQCTNICSSDADCDGIIDFYDPDDNNDGICDTDTDASGIQLLSDFDCDNILNEADIDSDGDGFCDSNTNGFGNKTFEDSDCDGFCDYDLDCDGIYDNNDVDFDNDGICDDDQTAAGTLLDLDLDCDGICPNDDDCDGIENVCDEDFASNLLGSIEQGFGTLDNPYQISTEDQFNEMRCDLNANYILTVDISFTADFEPIGTYTQPFSGTLDGNNFSLIDFTIDGSSDVELCAVGRNPSPTPPHATSDVRDDCGYVGLFASTDGAVIQNMIVNIHSHGINGDNFTGSIVGYASNSTLLNITIQGEGNVTGSCPEQYRPNYVGGVIGFIDNTTEVRHTTVNVNVESDGPCGSSGEGATGGIIGWSEGLLYQTAMTGNISSIDGFAHLGGVVGYNAGGSVICQSLSKGDVSQVSFDSLDGGHVGGLVGMQSGTITNSYATGNVSDSISGYSGGLVGYMYYGEQTVTNSYSIGTVSNGEGLIYGNGDYVSSSFWDVETSGQTTSNGGIGKTTVEMQTPSTFIDAGWSTTIWSLTNGDYPKLTWEE